MAYYYKQIAVISFILIILTSSYLVIPTPLDQDQVQTPKRIINEQLGSLNDIKPDHTTFSTDHANSGGIDKIKDRNSLVRYLEASREPGTTYSKSLTELLQLTPKSLRETVQTKFIITFSAYEKMSSHEFLKYSPELMSNLPIGIVRTTLESIEDIQAIPGVTGVFLDDHIPFSEDWSLKDSFDGCIFPTESIIGARYLQNMGINGTGIKIAILDTGIDENHPDLDDIDEIDSTNDPKVVLGASFIDFDDDGENDTKAMDDDGHGTHCAGIAAGVGNLKGVAPGAMLINGKVLDATIGGRTSWIVKGIDWAVSNGANIISMSLGGSPGSVSPLLNTAVNAAYDNGTLVVVAAGNSGPNQGTITSPGMASKALTVGASNVYNNVSLFSSRGPSITGLIDPDIHAPGRGILSTYPHGSYEILSGTSMATPAVSGAIALLLSAMPEVDIDTIRSAVLSTATDMGRHVFDQGAGLINVSAALEYIQNPAVFAYPAFTDSSPLVLSPEEIFEYQCDVFLNQSFAGLSIIPSAELDPHVNVSIIDSDQQGWIRTRIRIKMPNTTINGNIIIKNDTDTYYEANLVLKTDKNADDAGIGTDAGETFAGAIYLTIGESIAGELHNWDRDIFSFPVVKDKIYSVEMNNLTSSLNIQILDENGTIFARGSKTGFLPEEFVFSAETSGTYFITIEGQNPGKYDVLVRESGLNELSENIPADFSGKFESYTVDYDDDGLFDRLEIAVEVNVSKAGEYDFLYTVAQERPDYHYDLYVFMWDWLNLTLKEGSQNLTISIPGGIIESSGYDGSYIINDLVLGKSDFSQLLNYSSEVFSTPTYNHALFEPLDNRLDSYQLSERDIDKNGNPEYIMIELGIEFSNTGVNEVGVPIFNENQNELLAFPTKIVSVPSPGMINVSIELVIQQVENYGNIVLYGIAATWYEYLIPIFTGISIESLSTHDPILEYNITDHPIDSNENGENDSIRFMLSVTSKIETEVILFTGHPFSYPNETMILVNASTEEVALYQGTQEIWLDFDARMLKTHNLAGPYFFPNFGLTLRLSQNYNEENNMTLFSPYITKEYTTSHFEQSKVWFSKFLGVSKFVNSTNAGLEVTWGVTSRVQSEVVFELEIHEYEAIQGEFTESTNFTQKISPGTFNITFQLGAEELYNTKYIGGLEIYYVSIYELDSDNGLIHRFQESNLSLIDFGFHVGIIPSINYQDYAAYVDAYFIKVPEITFQSIGDKNLYNGLLVNTMVGINSAGTYELEINLFSENDHVIQNIENSVNISAIDFQNYTLPFFFSAKTIVRNGFDEFIYGNITIVNFNTHYRSEIGIPHFTINIGHFDHNLTISNVSMITDYALKENQNGNYDAVRVILQVEVNKESDFGFTAGIYAQLRNYNYYYLGNVTLSPTYLSIGLHNITVTVPYYYFLKILHKAEDLDRLPVLDIFIVPFSSTDEEGVFTIINQPLFLQKYYNLLEFSTIQPLSIGFVKTSQGDIDEDGNSDSVDVTTAIVIQDVLAYSLEIKLKIFWNKESKSLNKTDFYSPNTTGIIESTTRFRFSDIFSSSKLPSQFSVNFAINLISYDGIHMDTYVTPVNILFDIDIITSTSYYITPDLTKEEDLEEEKNTLISKIGVLMVVSILITSLTCIFIIFARRKLQV